MVPEEIKELNEESLSEYLSENENEIREGKNHAIAKLQKIVNGKNNQNSQVEDNLLKEAADVSEVTMFVRKCPPEKLMTMALLDKKTLSKAYSNPDSTIRQRAIFHFASNKTVKASIRAFRVQYPDWKKAKRLLPSEVELNNNTQTQLEVTKVLEDTKNEGKMKKKKKAVLGANNNKMKKKSGKKSLKRKKEGEGSEANGSCEMPQKKKVKKNSDVNNSSNIEEEKNTENGQENVQSPQKLSKKIGKKQNNLKNKQNKLKKKENNVKNKKNKMNAIEKVLLNGTNVINTSNQNLSPSSSPTAAESKVDATAGQRQENPRKGQEGKFHRKSSSKQGLTDRSKNWKTNFASKRNFNSRSGRPQSKWGAKKFADKSSVNMIDVSPDWKERCGTPKTDDGEKPSLLRPSWLTNPEERKPMPSYNAGRRFEKKEPHNSNMISVADQWKSKPTTPKKDDAPATSLLRPSWLTNPQESKPAPVKKFKVNSGKFKGNFKKSK